MKFSKTLTAVLITIMAFSSITQAQTEASISDFEVLSNTSWKGELMYVNYQDGQEVTLQTQMQISIKGNKITMSTQFGDEPEANSKSTIKLKKNGTYIGNEKIIEKTILEDGTVKLVTYYDGKDDNRLAKINKIYLFDGTHFSITKEVTFKDTEEKLTRNKYTYTKI